MARLFGTVTQGGADAFVQATIATALEGQTTNALRVLSISWSTILAGGSIFGVPATTQEVSFSFTRRTKTAIPDLTDPDLMKLFKYGCNAGSAVGQYVGPSQDEFRPVQELIIVEDPIFVQLDSTSTGQTQSWSWSIETEIVSISAIDRLTLLTLSL